MRIRTTLPDYGDPFYNNGAAGGFSDCITGSPTCPGRNVLSNCCGWANSRYDEIIKDETGIDYMNYQFTCNAENFTDRANEYGLPISPVPTLGGIMVWEGLGELAGHVAIVERIDNPNQIFTSESGWNCDYFWNATRTNDNGNWGMNSNYRFKGCIVNPAIQSKISLQAHVQEYGWLDPVGEGQWCGTRGESKRLEALKIDTEKAGFTIDEIDLHIAFDGWKNYKKPSKDEVLGTTGESKAIECIRIKALKEDGSPRFRFRVHQSMFGDTCWTLSDGISTLGSVGQSLPLEAIEMELI